MIIATCTATTDGAARRITYDCGAFFLEGQGAISAEEVLEYDRQGHLTWAREGLREWVAAQTAAAHG